MATSAPTDFPGSAPPRPNSSFSLPSWKPTIPAKNGRLPANPSTAPTLPPTCTRNTPSSSPRAVATPCSSTPKGDRCRCCASKAPSPVSRSTPKPPKSLASSKAIGAGLKAPRARFGKLPTYSTASSRAPLKPITAGGIRNFPPPPTGSICPTPT